MNEELHSKLYNMNATDATGRSWTSAPSPGEFTKTSILTVSRIRKMNAIELESSRSMELLP